MLEADLDYLNMMPSLGQSLILTCDITGLFHYRKFQRYTMARAIAAALLLPALQESQVVVFLTVFLTVKHVTLFGTHLVCITTQTYTFV